MTQCRRLTVEQAAEVLRSGGVIAYPTEAVYGLGCDPHDQQAVQRILALKSRPASAGLILISDTYERFKPFVASLESGLEQPAIESWPGPVTWLFPRAPEVPDWLAGSHPSIALRVTDHPTCRALTAAADMPIVSTSANPRGAAPALSAEQVEAFFGNRLDGIVEGDLGRQDRPSQIRDLLSGQVIRAA